MIVKATQRFLRDLEKIKSVEVLDQIGFTLDEIEDATSAQTVSGFKAFKSSSGFGRIRISDYRIGVQVTGKVMVLKCVLHRSVVYKNFP